VRELVVVLVRLHEGHFPQWCFCCCPTVKRASGASDTRGGWSRFRGVRYGAHRWEAEGRGLRRGPRYIAMEIPGASARLPAISDMRLLPAGLCLQLLAIASMAGSAFEALKHLTPEQLERLALIAAREGTPEPERWHILVYDPASKETGLREIVVAGGRKVADRPISQFAERLAASDVLPPDSVKIDSNQIEKLAMRYGSANRAMVSAMHFDLRKSGPESVPLWTVICLDSSGIELGKLIISATKGTVLMHPGFVAEPDLDTIAENSGTPERTTEATTDPPGQASRRDSETSRRRPPRERPQPVTGSTPKPGFLQRLFNPEKPKDPPR
jgi:hypothetical protein